MPNKQCHNTEFVNHISADGSGNGGSAGLSSYMYHLGSVNTTFLKLFTEPQDSLLYSSEPKSIHFGYLFARHRKMKPHH